jgi:hypothetical protein
MVENIAPETGEVSSTPLEQRQNSGEIGETDIHRSNRRAKPTSRFVNAVTIGLQIGRFFCTDPNWDTLSPLKLLPEKLLVPLEHHMTSSNFLTRAEVAKMREFYYLDRLNEEWDPHTEIEAILRHRHINYARRTPGKHTYNQSVSLGTTKGVRLLVRFFSGLKSWIPMEAARIDNSAPLIEYAKKW